MPTIATLDQKSRELMERLAKEIARYESQVNTMRKGEIAAVGGALDVFLKYSARWLCDQEGLEPDVVIRDASRAPSFGKATAGQVLQLIRELSTCMSARRPEVRVLCNEARKPRSRLERFIQLRNRALHEHGDAPDPQDVLPALRGLHNLIVSHRRTAGWEQVESA